jgi:hypothetical protein
MMNPFRQTTFSATSRYDAIETQELTGPDGRVIVYIRRRFVPPPERFALLVEHIVETGDRPDTVAAQYLDDSEGFWRICDANNAIAPNELTDTPGRRLRITLPEGIPGNTDG